MRNSIIINPVNRHCLSDDDDKNNNNFYDLMTVTLQLCETIVD